MEYQKESGSLFIPTPNLYLFQMCLIQVLCLFFQESTIIQTLRET